MAKDSAGEFIGYGEGDVSAECARVNHRLYAAYNTNSQARALGVIDNDLLFSAATKQATKNLARFINADPTLLGRMAGGKRLARAEDLGVADLAFRKAIGAYTPPPPPGPKYEIQGVWADSRAFLNPPEAHSFNKATDDFATEGYNLYAAKHAGRPVIPIGYSMGGVSVCKWLNRLRPEWRANVKAVITFGDPSMPEQGSLNGNTPGRGISNLHQPEWCWDRYWSYALPGDWYPQARGLLFLLYDVLTRAELTLDFAIYLLTQFPQRAMQELMGLAPSSDPLAGVLGGLAGAMTTGPANMVGSLLNPLQLVALLPQLIELLFDAVQFIATQAHGMYGDPGHAAWDGLTGVEHAVRVIQQHVPDGALLYLFPGTWSMWNQLFQFDVAARLQ